MSPQISPVNPSEIKASVKGAKVAGSSKAAFPDVMGDALLGASAMSAGAYEFVGQATGGSNIAGAVLNAAFSGIDVAHGFTPKGMGGYAGYGPYSSAPGMMGVGSYSTNMGYAGGIKAGVTVPGGVPGSIESSIGVDNPAAYQQELMQTMNANNLKLLELQAHMQSNMQSWTTRSNILSADHRARMSMIEKFSPR